MPNRRDIMLLAAAAAFTRTRRSHGADAAAHLETRLFNFRDDVSDNQIADIVAGFKSFGKLPGVDGLMIGRNFIPQPFPTRFEWIYMIQFPAGRVRSAGTIGQRLSALKAGLTSRCRNEVECSVTCPLPPRYADAAGVTVRHTVMFSFRPDASPKARERNVAAIRQMGHLPMVRHYLVQPSAAADPGPTQMQWQVIGDFASVADYQAYSQAPMHLAIRNDFKVHTSRVAFLDVKLT
jgi:hypothetical protein